MADLSLILFTLRVAAISTLCIIPLALALAAATRRMPTGVRTIVEVLCSLPLVMPPTAVGLILLELLSRRGPIGPILDRFHIQILFTPAAVMIATAVMSFPLMFRAFRAAFESANFRYFDIARTLGATPTRAFFQVIVPLAWPGLAAGVILAYCRAVGEFGATVLVAGNIPGRTQTLALAIFERVQSGRDDEAHSLLLIAVLIAVLAIGLSELLVRRQKSMA